ncbi:hypothetical protein MPSEU_001099700 [Mayamaea pseudoterrestris]|nr:hypothetical protein MPSEU_001099700 [Mayamaea pseudoterrestris]
MNTTSSLSPTTSYFDGTENANAKVRTVAGYVLKEKLGAGSFATVYRGVKLQAQQHDSAAADVVAVKAIARTSDKLTKKVLQNLEIEISILRTYRHRNIVCLHDVQKTDRHFYLLLEYCGGGDVTKLLRTRRSGRITEGLARRLMRDLQAGLQFLWSQELIHRDIKPQNLLLTGPLPLEEVNDPELTEELEEQRRRANFASDQFVLKIADFGFARHLQSASLAETLCGSPLYMAPEILQHHRYDAKADLWSVGTVLFEMITGRPPFHGENHIDLLRNIQKKAVKLPADVRVSKECVNLLRLLLNRNPLSRAGFKEFFEACNAFVALGCNGVAPLDEGTCQRPNMNELGTITEDDGSNHGADSMLTSASSHQPFERPRQQGAMQPVAPAPDRYATSAPVQIQGSLMTRTDALRAHGLAPLVPSPPSTSTPPIYTMYGRSTAKTYAVEPPQTTKHASPPASGSGDGDSFVMVEHGSILQKSPATSTVATSIVDNRHQLQNPSTQSSPGFFMHQKNPVLSTRGDYMVVKHPKGMLGTSPGTGGALMTMMSGRAIESSGSSHQLDNSIASVTKLLATAEDVGRRAVAVAHLGDQRAYLAMRLVAMNESSSSSLLSIMHMEGIEEEGRDGAVTEDDASDIMASERRRRSSSATDKSMPDAKAADDDDADEMPFAMHAESPLPHDIPTRDTITLHKGTSITSSGAAVKPTPAVIRLHFSEAVTCYLKALKMLKGTIAAVQRVASDLVAFVEYRLDPNQLLLVQKLQKRCEVTTTWLGGQFRGVLERGDATNVEIGKLSGAQGMSAQAESVGLPVMVSVEELVYNQSLVFGREGAVKQLLGQFEAARTCYRTAGLLAETLLMEPGLGDEDREILEGYVDGFAARITELDEIMLQQSRLGVGSSAMSVTGSSRRAPAVVSLVGQPFLSVSGSTHGR